MNQISLRYANETRNGHRPRVFGVIGWKNSGKTTLIEGLLREFSARGISVSTIKHAHHDFDIDIPGKDSHRHREAGASEVLVASDERWALMHEFRGAQRPTLNELIAHLAPCNLVLVEGFKSDTHVKIEVLRSLSGKARIADEDKTVCAVATDNPMLAGNHPYIPLSDIGAIADFISRQCGLVSIAASPGV